MMLTPLQLLRPLVLVLDPGHDQAADLGTPTNVATLLSSKFVALSDQRGDPANGTTHETPASRSAFTGTGA